MKILASDFDGTLFVDDEIKQSDLEKIKEFRRLGHKFGFVTGRIINSILPFIKEYEIEFDFLIGLNGGFIYDHDLNPIKETYVQASSIKFIIDYLNTLDFVSYSIHDGYRIARYSYENYMKREGVLYTNMDEILDNKVSGLFVRFKTEDEATSFVYEINQNHPDLLAHQNQVDVDLSAREIDKTKGIQTLLDKLGYQEKVYTIGDAQNDLSMIRTYESFALSHGNEDLKQEANYIVDSVSDAIDIILKKD